MYSSQRLWLKTILKYSLVASSTGLSLFSLQYFGRQESLSETAPIYHELKINPSQERVFVKNFQKKRTNPKKWTPTDFSKKQIDDNYRQNSFERYNQDEDDRNRDPFNGGRIKTQNEIYSESEANYRSFPPEERSAPKQSPNQAKQDEKNMESKKDSEVNLPFSSMNQLPTIAEGIPTSPSSPAGKRRKARIFGSVPHLEIPTQTLKMQKVSCSSPKIALFDIATISLLADNPIDQKELDKNFGFDFDPIALNLDFTTPSRYLVKVLGCDESYERIITSFYSSQSVTASSTLLAKTLKASISRSYDEIPRQSLENLSSYFERATPPQSANNLESIYSELEKSSSIKASFSETFGGVTPEILLTAAPDVVNLSIKQKLNEKETTQFIVTTKHWSSNYPFAYEWWVDEKLASTSAQFTFTPHANSKSTIPIKLVLGHKLATSGEVDRKYAHHIINTSVQIADLFPVMAPLVAWTPETKNPSNTLDLKIALTTGQTTTEGFSRCETFSAFAITETEVVPSPSDFTRVCSQGPSEEITYTLRESGDGVHYLRFYSRDANGKISTPQILAITIDRTPPVMIWSNLQAAYRGDRQQDFSFLATETNSSAALTFAIEFYDGLNWSSLPPLNALDGQLINSLFTFSHLIPNLNTNEAKLRLKFTDLAGNSSELTSAPFSLQKPILALSPSSHDFGAVLSMSSASGFPINLINDGAVAAENCGAANLTSTDASQFIIESNTCPSTIAAKSQCSILVAPKPTSKGLKTATLQVACDKDTLSSTLTFTSTNNLPVQANLQEFSGPEDKVLTFMLTPATDIDGDSLIYSIASPPKYGVLSNCIENNSNLLCSYLPNTNFNGTDNFTFKVYDGTGYSLAEGQVKLNITPVNDAPSLPATQSITTNEDTLVTFELNAGSDIDFDTITYLKVSDPAAGILNCDGGTSRFCSYTPAKDDIGSYTFTYKVNDSNADSNLATVTINISNTNDAPSMVGDQSSTTNEDTAVNFTLTGATDIDIPAQTLSYTVISPPQFGGLSNCIATGTYSTDLTCTYTPNADFNGIDTFTYKAFDGLTQSNTASTVTITINAVNDAPLAANNQSLTTAEDTPLNFNLNSGSDIDLPFQTLRYKLVAAPSNGTLSNCLTLGSYSTDLSCTYSPNNNFNGSDSFTYLVNDGLLDSVAITVVSIDVSAVNDPPVLASAQTISTNEDTSVNFTINPATDIDLPSQSLSYKLVAGPANGTLSGCITTSSYSPTRTCTYSPNANFNGSDSFTYKAYDGLVDSVTTQTITINIAAINDAPTLTANQTITTNEDTPVTFDLNAGTDIEGATLTYVKLTDPASGTLSCVGGVSRSCTYTPSLNFNGSTAFTYKTNDGQLDSNTATVTININATNDPPVVGAGQTFAINDNTAFNFVLNAGTDVDIPAQTLQYKLVSAPANGTLSNCINSSSYTTNRNCTFTAITNFSGVITFTYLVNDTVVDSQSTATITFNVTDATPPAAPALSLTSGDYTKTLAATFTASNCTDTPFIFFNEGSQPTAGSAGWQACSTAANALTYSLSAGAGTKTVKAWAKDSNGNVSTTATSFTIVYETTNPVLTINTPATTLRGGDTLSISWTATEANVTTAQNFVLEFFNGSSWTAIGTKASTNGPLSSTAFTYAWTIASTSTTSGQLRVSLTDRAGNTGSVTTNNFSIDATPPPLTINSPAENTTAQSSVTLSGNCETGLAIVFGGSGILNSFNGSCTAGTYTQQVFFKNDVDGVKTLSVSQTDAVGNTTTVQRNFVRDNLAPAITQTTLSYPQYSKTSPITFGGACETGLTVNISRGGVNEGTAACNSGAWTYTVVSQTNQGTYDYVFSQTDGANNTSSVNGRWILDKTAPALAITSGGGQVTASNSVTISGTCEAGLPTNIFASGAGTGSTTCNSGSWSYATPAQTTDGIRTYTFTLTDQAGNSTTVSTTWERNTNVPNLLISTAGPIINNTNNATFSGVCQTGLNIEILRDGVLETNLTCPSATFSYTTATQTTDANRLYQLKQTNAQSLSTTATIRWIRDTTPPAFIASSFKLSGDAATTKKVMVPVAIQATDALTNITQLCLKTNDSSAPSANHSCWVPVDSAAIGLTPSLNLNVTNYVYSLPIVPGDYTVYAWAKDTPGNISTLTSAGAGTLNTDRETITFYQAIAPVISYVLVGSTDYPANPPSTSDLTVGVGSPIYVKWKVSDDLALPATPISIYFTTDEVNWSLVAANLINGSNGSCAVNNPSTPADDDATGCYRLSAAPSAGFLKLRVTVKDSDGLEAGLGSMPLGVSSTIRYLGGNTDPGTNLSAQSAMFFYRRMSSELSSTDTQTLVVTRDGVVFFKDASRGILKVDPSDGVVRVFLPRTGVSAGDGGQATSATATYINKITLDYQQPKQRLWIYDYNRIRRVDLATGIITTVIGGPSATDNSDTVANPLNAKVQEYYHDYEWWDGWMLFFAAPNGDFYFRAGNDGYWDGDTRPSLGLFRVRRLEAATGQIKSWLVNSITSGRDLAAGDYTDCQLRNFALGFNPINSTITQRIGVVRRYPLWNTYCTGKGDGANWVAFDSNGAADAASHPYPPRDNPGYWWNERAKLITGLDGKIYSVAKEDILNGIFRYEGAPTYTWTRLLGGGAGDYAPGSCPDNTPATSCRSLAADVFVSENGTVYFLDDGLIRTITTDGKVVTLMGQRQVSGFGGAPLAARLGNSFRTFRLRNDGGITFTDPAHSKIYELNPSATLYHIAGNGVPGGAADGVDARTTYINIENPHNSGDEFGLDPVTGDIYHHAGTWYIKKLTRSSSAIGATGTWSNWIGGGTNHWSNPSSNGSNSIRWDGDCSYGVDTSIFQNWSCWFLPRVLTYANGKVVTHNSTVTWRISDGAGIPLNNMMKIYDVATKVQTHLIGRSGYNTVTDNPWDGLSAIGTSVDTSDFLSAEWQRVVLPYNLSGNRWLFIRHQGYGDGRVFDVQPGGTLNLFTTLASSAKSFSYRLNGSTQYIYYCSAAGNLVRRNVTAATEVTFSWPVTGMICEGNALFYRASTQSVVFAYRFNGLMGFAEYLDPM